MWASMGMLVGVTRGNLAIVEALIGLSNTVNFIRVRQWQLAVDQ